MPTRARITKSSKLGRASKPQDCTHCGISWQCFLASVGGVIRGGVIRGGVIRGGVIRDAFVLNDASVCTGRPLWERMSTCAFLRGARTKWSWRDCIAFNAVKMTKAIDAQCVGQLLCMQQLTWAGACCVQPMLLYGHVRSAPLKRMPAAAFASLMYVL
jgi:hypothetical protein